MSSTIRIGTRGSKLALAQSGWVRQQLQALHPGRSIELIVIKTTGDRFVDRPLSTLGGKGVFVKEIEEAMQAGSIDCAVHSMKDVPGELAPGLVIAAVPPREDPRDALLTRDGRPLAELAAGARVGTSSLRRMALIRSLRPDCEIVPLRGNIDTRLQKLEQGEFDAIILAVAGLRRLAVEHANISQLLDLESFIPAPAQGALAIESRDDDTVALLAGLEHPASRVTTAAERAFLQQVEGSCRTPLAAHAVLEGGTISLRAMVASLDGTRVVSGSHRGPANEAIEIGRHLGEEILQRGGAEILRALESNEDGR